MMLHLLMCFWSVVGLTSAAGNDLPPSIEQCSLSDPNLSNCFKEKANLAIPSLVKGYKEFDIPQIVPLEMETVPCYMDGATVVLHDVHSEAFKNFAITDALFDLKAGKVEFEAIMDPVEVIAKDYTVVNGTIIDKKASGHGMFNMTMVKLTTSFKADTRVYKKGGEDYLELVHSKITTNVDRGYYYFENLVSDEEGDMNAYIDKNWQKFRQQLMPAVESYMKTFVYYPVNVIFSKVPMNKMFLP